MKNFKDFLQEVVSIQQLDNLIELPNFLIIFLCLFILWIGKVVFDLTVSYSVEHQLVKADNKAFSIAFTGYIGGIAAILEGVLEVEGTATKSLTHELISVVAWGSFGIILLILAGIINDKLILRAFDNKKELIEKHNIGVGAVTAGSYLGSALLIRGIIRGESDFVWYVDAGLTLFYFVLAQIMFFVFSVFYQKITDYDLHAEIESGNDAAGVSFGMGLVAMGILLAAPLKSYSIPLFIGWFVLGSSVLAMTRFILDRIIIPSEKLDKEIHTDQNWGIALLEGGFTILAAVLLVNIF
ncbi:MAG: uncharacterized membrane protein YjfL (UPF0719 family) [bacterium]|jgi:uncharacterized membrane protein YjfL (UPF0719 family)